MSRPKQRPLTLRDVSEACGVSEMTVSRVLRNRGDVSAGTRGNDLFSATRAEHRHRGGEKQKITMLRNTVHGQELRWGLCAAERGCHVKARQKTRGPSVDEPYQRSLL